MKTVLPKEDYYNVQSGIYVGVIVKKDIANKIDAIAKRQQQEIIDFLNDNLDDVSTYSWTLAYPDEKQTSVVYMPPIGEDSKEGKIRTISSLSLEYKPKKVENLVFAKSGKEAEYNYLELHNKLEYLRKG